tara:strand:+ start:72 stop:353 length:282 start_codon:yes stop_codon:yes gene_type:complete
MTPPLEPLIDRARQGDLDAYGQVVDATRTMATAVAFGVLRDAGVEATAMRKRLQRVRDKLRKEMEMSEQRELDTATSTGRCRPRSWNCWRGRG